MLPYILNNVEDGKIAPTADELVAVTLGNESLLGIAG